METETSSEDFQAIAKGRLIASVVITTGFRNPSVFCYHARDIRFTRPGALVITYRTFLNSDPPQLVALWNRQADLANRLKKVSNVLLENQVFAKLYFDPDGFIVAIDGDTIVGFVHCGFGPDQTFDSLDYRTGIISQLVISQEQSSEVAVHLIQRAIQYFDAQGTKQIYVGSQFPVSPFYQGLYGGTQVPGVFKKEVSKIDAFVLAGFREVATIEVWQLDLANLKSPIDRPLMAARREFEIQCVSYAEQRTWWDHCRFGDQGHLQFRLLNRKLQVECGNIQYWTTHPIDSGWDQSLLGMGKIEIVEEYLREDGVAACFILDSLKRLAKDGFVRVEAQFDARDQCIRPMLPRFGFSLHNEAIQLMRTNAT